MYEFARGVYAGQVEGQIVFFDLNRDTYSCLSVSDSKTFIHIVQDGRQSLQTEILLRELERQNLVVCGQSNFLRGLVLGNLPSPNDDILEDNGLANWPPLWSVLLVFFAQVCVYVALKIRPLQSILSSINESLRQRSFYKAEDLAKRYLQARAILLFPRWCLFQSLSLKLYLSWHGYSSSVVFGIQLIPFSAHCWLQIDNLILNDELARVETFTPICAV